MKLEERIVLFSELGNYILNHIASDEMQSLFAAARSRNAWFTTDNLRLSVTQVAEHFLNTEKLNALVSRYDRSFFEPEVSHRVGIVAAGNIPLVGIQDLIHVVLTGHIAYYKPSAQDEVLTLFLIRKMREMNPAVAEFLVPADKLTGLEAYIATGSGNTSRYFEYYFGKKPNIIRKNRVSVAVLSGSETRMQLSDLGNDIFEYFGLGCRNVSKLYVPEGYDFRDFFEAVEYWNSITLHSKYVNNYDYNKSIFLVNGDKHLDNGFLLLKESSALHSPISTVFYEEYASADRVFEDLQAQNENIQCIVTEMRENGILFGKSQSPELWDYADGVDTVAFLAGL